MTHLCSHNLVSGTVRLSQDIATLINDRQSSDIQFIVGGGDTTALQENSAMTIYAHSVILRCRSRYFATMLDKKNQWKESSERVIRKPNISPSTFQDVLHYIYTGNTRAKVTENIIELIAAAEEMELDELSIECQAEVIRIAKISLRDKDDTDDENDIDKKLEKSTEWPLPVDIAVRALIIPALKIASSHNISHFSNQIITTMLPRMTAIIASPNAYAALVSGISSQALVNILAADNLIMAEHDVWELALNWGCHHSKLNKAAVEARLNNTEDDEEEDNPRSSDESMISYGDDGLDEHARENSYHPFVPTIQLKQLKTILAPLLPNIRFSLFEPEDYADMGDILSYFLPRHRSSELQRFFIKSNYTRQNTKQLDIPRMNSLGEKISSKIIKTWGLVGEYILGIGGIAGCLSLNHLKLELLFRASEHDFSGSTFHQLCDDKGPTLTIVRSSDGHLFGGVNFDSWNSNGNYSQNVLNFLFALSDGCHRKDSVIFKHSGSRTLLMSTTPFGSTARFGSTTPFGSRSTASFGPSFGSSFGSSIHSLGVPSNPNNFGPSFGDLSVGFDLYIADCANMNKDSSSNLPHSYHGSEASKTALAGTEKFIVSNYEVFAITKQ